jgi:DNA-binding PadR family transcriptional regulator
VYLDILILAELAVDPAHGYELRKRIRGTLGGRVQINSNTLYPALRRFTDEGALIRREQRHEGRPPRLVYELTDEGRSRLRRLLTDFGPELARSDEEFLTRVAFFGMLGPEERAGVLRARGEALAEREAHLRELQRRAERESPGGREGDPDGRAWPREVLCFQLDGVAAERRWLRRLASPPGSEGARD